MASRCPDAIPADIATLSDWEFSIYERGYATVARKSGSTVLGGLWEVSAKDLRQLDLYEGVARGLYRRRLLTVKTQDGPTQAVIYIANRTQDGQANPGYVERVIAGAQWFGLSNSYVAQLSTWLA